MAEFDLEEAKKKFAPMYEATMPDPKCTVCKGSGYRTMTMCIGQDTQEIPTYCDCTVGGFLTGNTVKKGKK